MRLDTAYPTLTATLIAELVGRGELSAAEVTDAALRCLDQIDDQLRAFSEIWPERARAAARDVDRAVRRGAHRPLAGVPIAVKASEGLGRLQAQRLIAAGCVPIGATAVPRGTPWQTWGHTDRGPTRNPWRSDRVPGGSSAGSAAAVAAGIVPMATASDGAGSIRIPAAWCGVVGVKPTNGLIPARDRAGLTSGGPLTRTVADAAAYLDAVLDTTYARSLTSPLARPVRAVWSTTLGYAATDPQTAAVARATAEVLATGGAIRWSDTPVRLEDPEPAWRTLCDPNGTDTATADALRHENDRRLAGLFERVDVLITPTTPTGPHGHEGPGTVMNVSLTWAFNLSGHPAVSVPAGLGVDGTPVGLQLVARPDEEATLLRLAASIERLSPWPPAPRQGPHR